MQDNTVTITVTMTVKSGLEDRVRGILKGFAEASHEDGCLEYRIYESLIYPLVFMVYGRWRDEAAYMKYPASPRTKGSSMRTSAPGWAAWGARSPSSASASPFG